ncbi:MAG: metal ABC transporter ATP-binding protein [Candidatus Thioglobus sp.]|nr:MAG: metal ABC transporter ATP-binding protein [Candidatus Thioglobus sp.]KAA0446233.1 MAG: metal ABC transporter ATP-binding protein [Candidatus Thioglobus sp.]
MTTNKALISAENVSLKHEQKTVLDKVSFELKQGEFITIIGPNGAGKSSLIKVLLGLIKADSGKVWKRKNIKIGYTPQSFIPNPFMPICVLDFLNLNQKIEKDFLHKTAQLTGIDSLLNSALKNLSGGELQRLLLTRALLCKPDVLILDEPAQNLDVNGQIQLYKLIQDIHQQQGSAVLMISHDLHRVMRESTQVLCLYHHICCMGQPETIIKDRQFNHLFAEQMDDLMATYEHHHNHSHEH